MSSLVKTMKRLISSGKTEGLLEKVELFYKTGRLNEDEYKYLVEVLSGDSSEAEVTE